MTLPEWTIWIGVCAVAVVMIAAGILMIRLTAKLPDLIRAFVAVICGGLLVIFAGFRVLSQLNLHGNQSSELPTVGFDIVPIVLQTSLMTGVILLGYLIGILFEERRLTRAKQENRSLSEANN